MKSGATDPFANDDQDSQSDDPNQTENTGSNTSQSDSSVQPENQQQTADSTTQIDRSDLPRILTRDTVKEDRDAVHQLFVYSDTAEREKEARRELEDRLGDVYKLDAREAIYRAGMENIDDAEEILREWGADI
ncbi:MULTISPECIES: hypothetical protein [Natrialbaceae]|uniref:hypothetical protein n=1 Tax=Natrialbaceae TaxID=1644061 RepID=UPI00207D54CA|nr:hypothetical protein [Natronococcus sp. CG52]